MQEVKNKILELREKINDHNYNYYVVDNPVISDIEYDTLLRELDQLEKQYPDLISPTPQPNGLGLHLFHHSNPLNTVFLCFHLRMR